MKVIETERLILRTWQQSDVEPFYQINQDPKVIEFLRGPMTKQEVIDFIAQMNQQFDANRYTCFAAEEKSSGKFIGFIGLNTPSFQAHFTPCVEIGWRLGSAHWGKGYATEGAKAALNYGFSVLGLNEIVAFTIPMNHRSIRVMEKVGMQRDVNGDFAHPKLPLNHLFSHHILFRLRKP